MPKRTPAPEPQDSASREPRDTFALIGHETALNRAARAIRSGRPPPGWLVAGPPGIGKATFAFRIARYLLKYGARADGPDDLAVAANDPVSLQIAAGAHPGLLVLRRPVNPNTGKRTAVLPVDEVRRLAPFFGMTAGAGGWRVAIVDTADDMNDAAANALLKTLEEPPLRAMILVLSNNPGRLLPTIRSRCRRLDLRPLPQSAVEAALAQLVPGLGAEQGAALARLSGGSLGAALELAEGEGLALAREADRLIDHADAPDTVSLLALGDRIARLGDGLDDLGRFLGDALNARIRDRAMKAGTRGLRPWIDASERLHQLFGRSSALYLDPRQTVLSAASALSAARSRGGAL